MTKRFQKFMLTSAALASLALGGAVFAQAQSTTPAASEKVTAPDTDNVQSGDQTTPDSSAKASRKIHHTRHHATKASEVPGVEAPGETGSESGPSDGPGGHADPAGSTADHQFQGNE